MERMKGRLHCIWFVAATLLSFAAAAKPRLEVETGTSYHSAVRPATNLVARIDFEAESPVRWRGMIVFRDYFGKSFSVPVDGEGSKRQSIRVKLPEPPSMGVWRGIATLASVSGGTAVCVANFAVLDPHPVTPLAPRDSFRFGINYHMIRYSDEVRRKTMEALVGVGAKLMRGNFAPLCFVQPEEGVFRWEQTDEFVAELLKHGIAIDAIIPTVPQWAKHPDYASLTNGPVWAVPTKPGVAEAYGKALARRYGTKFEYYEIGNEYDLLPKSHMPIEKAIECQRDYYRGIKAACSEAKVIPGGWALADSSSWMVKQKGFQERFMKEAQDVCDFHPIHVHASYEKYRKEMMKFFAWRQREGVTIPWYANETAMTSRGQEDAAAVWVWQKPLWAWAHGSVDYIWYNLRATGDDVDNAEHMYGIFSSDLQPRPTAAAFSALTSVFNGLKFDTILRDSEACQCYRFRGDGEIVISGWDAFARTPRSIAVATDATSAEMVDIMGNRSEMEVRDGRSALMLGKLPVALVLKGGTQAEPDAVALARDAERNLIEVAAVFSPTRPKDPVLVLDSIERIQGFCDGNPLTEHRVWKGPQDLSAKVWCWRTRWDDVAFRIEVTDDRAVVFGPGENRTGDHVRIAFGGAAWTFEPVSNTDGTALYEFTLPKNIEYGRFALEIYDDDGEGLDSCLGGDEFLLRRK